MDDNSLWITLEGRLRQHNISLDEVAKSDQTTRGRIFGSLGFDPAQEARLVGMASAKLDRGGRMPSSSEGSGGVPFGPSSGGPRLPTGGPFSGGSPPASGSGGVPFGPGSPNTGGGHASPAPATGGYNNNNNMLHHDSNPSRVQGLSRDGDQLIARCSVYPHLPAEFWCCACNVLVSSRCHVQGIHKDHPFITLRLAAESHVRDVCAWNERARTQLNVTSSVLNNLKHADTLLNQTAAKQYEELDQCVQRMVEELMQWKETLRRDIDGQLSSQQAGIAHAVNQTTNLHTLYSGYLGQSEPLMSNVPPVDETGGRAEDWALRVLDLVSKLKHVNAEAIPMPKLTVPAVTCLATPATNMELLKCVSAPIGVRLPDIIDPGYFNFPHPAMSAKMPFSLVANEDAVAKGILIYNGRTLTRAQDVVPSHSLVLGSQVFYSGITSWEVHIDRMGPGSGRILAGITVNGSDGEGVVWDGSRIVGPNEGEARTLDDRYNWRPGTILRFHLELEPPTCFLNCFFDREGVARIPLPSNGNGWCPAFSVFGPQDQVTIVPATNQATAAKAGAADRKSLAAHGGDTMAKIDRQDHLLSSLQQQVNAVATRLEHEHLKQEYPHGSPSSSAAAATGGGGGQYAAAASPSSAGRPAAPGGGGGGGGQYGAPQQQPSPYGGGAAAAPTTTGTPSFAAAPGQPVHQYVPPPTRGSGGGGGSGRQPLEAYSPELRHLMRFVESGGQ